MIQAPLLDSPISFDEVGLAALEAMGDGELDALPFGVIGLDGQDAVIRYNALESRLAGLPRDTVVGRHFYTAVAPCMNNALVAGRFEAADRLDAVIDYVLTFRMRPTRVRMRLIKDASAACSYILIHR